MGRRAITAERLRMTTRRARPKGPATPKAGAEATSGDVASGRSVGGQFTKRTERAGLVKLDPDDSFSIEGAKVRARQTLEASGYAIAALYGVAGECYALERVLLDGHLNDSPLGLAAAVLWHCRELELLSESDPKHWAPGHQWQRAAQHAYAVGRLDAFRKAYVIQSAAGKKGGSPQQADHERVRRFHARIAHEFGATTRTATEFGISTRAVRKILAE
jgi:hypothetical protein